MPYLIEAQAKRGYLCRVTFRVKRDAFAAARMAACLLRFPDDDIERLAEARMGPEQREMVIETSTGKLSVRRIA